MKISFNTDGTPQTQGSTKAFVVAGRARVTHTKGKALMDWRSDIARSAQEAADGAFVPRGTAVHLAAIFRLQRPASTPKRVVDQVKRPDIDKLTRALFDALSGVLWVDDSQVVKFTIEKRFARDDEAPGVRVWVEWEG
jgi:Holliday junction resolvase RusA-like endonuclease